jgi:hypothetical protein
VDGKAATANAAAAPIANRVRLMFISSVRFNCKTTHGGQLGCGVRTPYLGLINAIGGAEFMAWLGALTPGRACLVVHDPMKAGEFPAGPA